MPVGGAFKGGFAGVVGAILANDFCETMTIVALIDASFVGIAAIGVKNVNLAKLLVRVYAHAIVVGGVHDLLREGAYSPSLCLLSKVKVPSRGFSYLLTP